MMPHPQPPVYVESHIVCCRWMVRPWQSMWRFSFAATASGCAKDGRIRPTRCMYEEG
jgi:hypothetical protein